MAHFNMPAGGDPTTIAWLKLSRKRRRAAMFDARRALRGEIIFDEATRRRDGPVASIEGTKITKAQRRAATPWQPIVVPPGDAHFLSGRPSSETARLILLGLNRRERRALRSKGGPRHEVRDYQTGHVSRSERCMTPLLSRLWIYAEAEKRRRALASAQTFQASPLGKVARLAATAAAVPIVAGKHLAAAVKRLFGGSAE